MKEIEMDKRPATHDEQDVLRSALTASTEYVYDIDAELQNISAGLVAKQEPLGAEFEAIWDANVGRLYEDGEPANVKAIEIANAPPPSKDA